MRLIVLIIISILLSLLLTYPGITNAELTSPISPPPVTHKIYLPIVSRYERSIENMMLQRSDLVDDHMYTLTKSGNQRISQKLKDMGVQSIYNHTFISNTSVHPDVIHTIIFTSDPNTYIDYRMFHYLLSPSTYEMPVTVGDYSRGVVMKSRYVGHGKNNAVLFAKSGVVSVIEQSESYMEPPFDQTLGYAKIIEDRIY